MIAKGRGNGKRENEDYLADYLFFNKTYDKTKEKLTFPCQTRKRNIG